jgi:hypothetical protein
MAIQVIKVVGRIAIFFLACICIIGCLARTPLPFNPPPPYIPPRPHDAMSATEFLRRTAGMSEMDRETLALGEIRKGNVPQFMRSFRPVYLSGPNNSKVTVWVMPDYIALGSDEDFLRMPLSFPAALEIANEFGCSLPTTKIVDAIYQQADIKLEPWPLPAGDLMRSNDYYLRHQRFIQAQLRDTLPGTLVAGHKKDLVVTNRLFSRPGKVAIYGWHRLNGTPIQPLSTWHGINYADYSHGVRLISKQVLLDGQVWPLSELLKDPNLAALVSDEGVISDLSTLRVARPGGRQYS